MKPGTTRWLVAFLACEYGFDPEAILDWSPGVMDAVMAVHKWRADELRKAQAHGS